MISTRNELLEKRINEKISDTTNDIDRTGNIGSLDYFIAKRYDNCQDGKLAQEEQKSAREFMGPDSNQFNLEGENQQKPNRFLQNKRIPIYDDNFHTLNQSDNSEDPERFTLSKLHEKRKKERIEKGLIIAETKIIHKNPTLFLPRSPPAIRNKSKFAQQRKIEREQARESQGLLKKPDALAPKMLSTNYNEFPKVQSKFELESCRKKIISDEIIKQSKWDYKQMQNEVEKKTSLWSAQLDKATLNFKEKLAEIKKKDVEQTISLFTKSAYGVHKAELPKFQENCKEYWQLKRSYTPTPTYISQSQLNTDRTYLDSNPKTDRPSISITPPRARSTTPTLPLKPTAFYPTPDKKFQLINSEPNFNHFKKYKFTETFTNSLPHTDRSQENLSKSPISRYNKRKYSPIRSKGFNYKK